MRCSNNNFKFAPLFLQNPLRHEHIESSPQDLFCRDYPVPFIFCGHRIRAAGCSDTVTEKPYYGLMDIIPSWPELKLDSQWIEEQSQLLEEAYQEKSEEKKQLFVFHFKNVGQFYPRMVDTVGLIFPGVPAISQIVSDFIFRKNGESFDSLHCRCAWCCRMLFLFVPVNDLDSGYFGDDPYPHVTTIVFSKGMKQAMVGFRTGDRSGKIGYCLLKRKGRKWKAIRYVTPIEYI